MKKILFLLLLTVASYGQVSTGQETEFDYGIKNNSTQTITTPPYLTTTGIDGTQGKIPSALIEKTDNKQNSLTVDGTGTKYPTVDAVNAVLPALQAQINNKADLDGSGKVPLSQINDALLGSVNYKGTYNATTNVPAIPTATSSNKGWYYIISTGGTQQGFNFVNGDWIISNGISWGKVDNNNTVTSVNGQVGAVNLTKSDVGLGNVDNTSDVNKPISTATQSALDLKQNTLANPITGTLTSGYIPKATGANSLGNSLIYDNVTNVGIGTTSPSAKLHVIGGNLIATSFSDVATKSSFRIDTANNAISLTVGYDGTDNVFIQSINSQLNTIKPLLLNPYGGNVLIGTTTDNGIDRVQVNGTISATGGTTANQVVVKSQLDAKVSLTGNETIAGVKSFSSGKINILDLSFSQYASINVDDEVFILKNRSDVNQFSITPNGFSSYKSAIISANFTNSILTANRTYTLPNASGTIALAETIKPYKVYTALLSQSGTSAPTATVLENTLGGTVVWTRSNTGQYVGTLTGAFTDQKTIIFVNRSNPAATAFDTNMAANVININTVGYTTFSNSAYVDGQTNSASIEIRVYN